MPKELKLKNENIVCPSNDYILELILKDDKRFPIYYTYIVDGNRGPTGKSWLTIKLREHGYNALDVSELLLNHDYNYTNDSNTVSIDRDSKVVYIVLNAILPKYRENWGKSFYAC